MRTHYTTITDLTADVSERLGLPDLPDDAVHAALVAVGQPRYEQIDAATLDRILRATWEAAIGEPYPFEPESCPTCLDGTVVSDTCDDCGARHCPVCEDC